jgi:hypothetical protein
MLRSNPKSTQEHMEQTTMSAKKEDPGLVYSEMLQKGQCSKDPLAADLPVMLLT